MEDYSLDYLSFVQQIAFQIRFLARFFFYDLFQFPLQISYLLIFSITTWNRQRWNHRVFCRVRTARISLYNWDTISSPSHDRVSLVSSVACVLFRCRELSNRLSAVSRRPQWDVAKPRYMGTPRRCKILGVCLTILLRAEVSQHAFLK